MKIISFDIAGIILLCLLLMSAVFRKMTSGASNKIFIISVILAIVTSSYDILAASLDNMNDPSWAMLYSAHTGYLLAHSAQTPLHLLFVISLTGTWHKVRQNAVLLCVFVLPYAFDVIILLINPFCQCIFSVARGYRHEWLFNALYVCVIPYIIMEIVLIVVYRKLLNLRKIVSLCSMTVLCIAAVIIQYIAPNLLVECFAVAVSLSIVGVGIQRPEDYIDSFTGLINHSAYGDEMRRAFANERHTNVIMLNIANYSAIQNMMGFDAATCVLAMVADKMRYINNNLKCKADMYYLDRGRFRMVFSDTRRVKAETAAQLLLNDLKLRATVNGLDLNLTPSIVLARCPEEIESFKSLMAFGQDFHEKNPYSGQVMQAADVYNAKKFNIKNNIDSIIDNALENNLFEVYYQPIYSIEQKRFVSAEALLRLNDKEYGFISPEILVPAAEQNGAIHKIGAYVFEEVCRFISSEEYKKLGIDYIEVNLSVAQCMNGDLADMILGTMRKYDISSDRINLEITETAASYSQRVMSDNLNKLSKAGLSFSLDDYGTGYSNMKRVISLPLKIVKLDKSFVDEQHNPKMWIFLRNTVKMLKDMDMEIVVEGIETQEMLDAFTDLKCDFIQGYFFSKPINREAFVKFVSEFASVK